jgi:hypothetical protein
MNSVPTVFTVTISAVAPIGPNVVLSFAGFEPAENGKDATMPVVLRVVMPRDSLVQSIEFLQGWLNGQSTAVDPSGVQ